MPAPITCDDLYLFRWVDHVRLSPDGSRVAYAVAWADADARDNRSRVHIRPVEGGEPVELTTGPKRDHSPEWSPDGRRLAYLSRRGARDQLVVIPASGGDARQLTSFPDRVAAPRWSPDGRLIAFLGTVIGDPEGVVDDPRAPETEDQTRRSPIARVVRRLDYKHDGSGYVDGRHQHLFVIPAEGGEPVQLTFGAWSVEGYDWAPDSRRLVVVGDAEPDADLRRDTNLYVVDLEAGRTLLAGGMELSTPAWSPRGDQVAFLAPKDRGSGNHERLFLVPAAGGEPRCLTAGFDQNLGGGVINDMRGGHATRLVWSGDGASITFQASSPGAAGLWEIPAAGGEPRQVAGGRRAVYDFDVVADVTAFLASDPTRPGDVHVSRAGQERRLGDLNPWLSDRHLALPEHQQLTGPDGLPLEGWLLKPPGFDASRKHPLVMEIHGGPHGQYGWSFFHEFQVLAGEGFLVFYMNPRGSDGYGEEFKRACVRDWGGKDYQDLMTGLDQLIERTGFVDTGRMGVGGGSYGGYMTNWVVGHTDRFAAAVSMRSISNLVSEYAQHDIVLWSELEIGPQPWPDPDFLWQRSPIRYVNEVRTPLLLLHGEMDLRCAISQAEEMFGALRLLGKRVELVRFPGESHDLSRGGRPDRRVERLERIRDWFREHLQEAPAAVPQGRTVTA